MDQYLSMIPPTLFGFALQRGRVHETSIIMGQMTFTHFVMLKMFLSAVGSSCLVTAHYYKTKCTTEEQREKFYQRANRGIYAVLIGAALVGIGMALSGSCPGSVYAQLGALTWLAIPVLLGGIAAAVVYELYSKQLEEQFPILSPTNIIPKESNALYKIVNAKYGLNLLPEQFLTYMGGAFLAMAVLFELIVNWKKDLSGLYPDTWQDLTLLVAQPAILSGVLIGIAQYISLSQFDKQLGCSFTFVEIAQIIVEKGKPEVNKLKNPQLDAMCDCIPATITTPQNKPNPITAYGMVLGGFIGALTAGSLYVGRAATDFPPLGAVGSGFFGILFLTIRIFIGGFISVFGARIAGGCTSGLGLSYTSTGSTTGFLGMATMFGAAILTGLIFKFILGLN